MGSTIIVFELAAGLAGGLVLGGLYFALLFRSVRLHVAETAIRRVVPFHFARIVLAVGFFWAMAQLGALPLLTALAGFLLARVVLQHRLGCD